LDPAPIDGVAFGKSLGEIITKAVAKDLVEISESIKKGLCGGHRTAALHLR
jgi:hypothetical protein